MRWAPRAIPLRVGTVAAIRSISTLEQEQGRTAKQDQEPTRKIAFLKRARPDRGWPSFSLLTVHPPDDAKS